GFEILLKKLICSTELLVSVVLFGSANIRAVVNRGWEEVICLLPFLDHCYLARRKVLELLLLCCRFRRDHLKSGGHQHAFSVLHGGLCGGAAHEQCYGYNRDKGDESCRVRFHFCSYLRLS